MSTPSLPDLVRQAALLSEIRGGADLDDLRAASAAIDRLLPAEFVRFEAEARLSGGTAFGIPPAIAAHIRQLAGAQSDTFLQACRAAIPNVLRRLLDLGAVTTDQALVLARDCGIATVVDLDAAVRERRLSRLPDAAVERLEQVTPVLLAEHRPVPLGRTLDLLDRLMAVIESAGPLVVNRSITGDARRFEPFVRTPSLAAAASDPAQLIDALCSSAIVEQVLHRTPRRVILVVQHAEVDVRVAAPDEWGSVLFAATGSAAHVRTVLERRRRPALCSREEDVYREAGVPWIPPELRHDTGEFDAATSGALPTLVEAKDIRGDLHMHSTYSDGQDPIEVMVQAAVALGYEYIAITDHSESATASRTLTLGQLARQREEIERLRQLHPGITILHGIEVDILPDGRLDFADAILEGLDIVLASLHDAARQDGAALTRRCIQAMRHPLVNVITHPANQIIGRRAPYPLDFAALYEAAAESGTALEIDGAPSHLDLDGEHARDAVAAGVTLTIDSDCHRARALGAQMKMGVGTARRGWVEARHVLNCRPVDEVRAFVRAKRAGRPAAGL